MREFNDREIELLLQELGDSLAEHGMKTPLRILVVGGAYMLTQLHNRPATRDIDVFFKDIEDPSLSPEYTILQDAVREIAARHQIPTNWFNDVVGDALRINGSVPEGTLWRVFGMLEVYVPPIDYMLALKLMAGRERDHEDITLLIQTLHITTRAEAQTILDTYIPDQQLQVLNDVPTTLSIYFP